MNPGSGCLGSFGFKVCLYHFCSEGGIAAYHDVHISDKRALRICRSRDIKSTVKYANHGCTRNAENPQYLAENILDRDFRADRPNEKWLTDVTEFKWYENGEKRKVYLSAILDLYDRRIVAYVIRDSNDNPLVYDTFDAAVKAHISFILFHCTLDGEQFTIQGEQVLLIVISFLLKQVII